jgi:coatomer subunit beta
VIYGIYLEFENIIPDAPELLQTFLSVESDATCKRIAFVFLVHCAMSKAVEWILNVYEQISGLVELLQMSVIEAVRLDCKNDSAHRVSAIQTVNWYCILNLPTRLSIPNAFSSFCNASLHAFKYEAVTTLAILTQNLEGMKGGFFVAFGSV